jgi:hypothetical protein
MIESLAKVNGCFETAIEVDKKWISSTFGWF